MARSYDAAGDLLNDGVYNYTYDAEIWIMTVDRETQYYYTPGAIHHLSFRLMKVHPEAVSNGAD